MPAGSLRHGARRRLIRRSARRSRADACSRRGAGARPRLRRRRLDAARLRAAGELGHPLETLHVSARAARGRERGRCGGLSRPRRARSPCPIASWKVASSRVPESRRARAGLRRAAGGRGARRPCARHRSHARRPRRDDPLPPRRVAGRRCVRRAALGGRRRARPAAARARPRGGARRAAPRGHRWRDDSSNADRGARAQPRAPRPPAGVPLAAPGGGGQPAGDCRARWPRTTLRSTRSPRSCSCEGGGLSTAAVAAAPPAVLRRALRRVAGFPAPRPVAAERVGALARAARAAGSVPLGAGRVAERRYAASSSSRRRAARAAAARGRARGARRTPYGDAVVHCALAAAERALDAELAPLARCCARRVRASGCPGARRTIARMLLEARVPRSQRARYPVVSAHGEAVALPGIAVAPRPATTFWTRADPRRHVTGSACRSRRRARGRADLGGRARARGSSSWASRSRATTTVSIHCS